jgi:Fe-S-cluster-containing dehydrogenase component/DMSO reductase anchor subunit
MVAERQPLNNFLAELLAEQSQLQTPVTRASLAYDRSKIGNRISKIHSDLIPLSKPGPGEQYAFEVDLDSCSGCKACVVACHALNGLEENESWRDVGFVHGGSRAAPFQQTVTTACHHCADPGCLNGCPVLAYEKDPVTGIVRHLDDQCIGCQYCILKCPYDVPKYSERLGIVRKCDMCHNRLAEGEAPACVQACPTQAIKIVKVEIHVGRADTSQFLSAAPDPSYTQPTTRYLSQRPLPSNAVAADAAALRPQPPHWPLVVMLTLLPMAVGCFCAGVFSPSAMLLRLGWLAGALGLGASVFHLGQPLRAWRIFLGWRKSWLSREALVFGAWFPAATAALFFPGLVPAAAAVGCAGLLCSVMVYVDTHRVLWRFNQTASRFFGTALVLGLVPVAPAAAALASAAKLALEARSLRGPATSARLLRGPLRRAITLRFSLGLAGGVLLLLAPGWPALAGILAGELAERYLFFRAVDAPKMPGSVRS